MTQLVRYTWLLGRGDLDDFRWKYHGRDPQEARTVGVWGEIGTTGLRLVAVVAGYLYGNMTKNGFHVRYSKGNPDWDLHLNPPIHVTVGAYEQILVHEGHDWL